MSNFLKVYFINVLVKNNKEPKKPLKKKL